MIGVLVHWVLEKRRRRGYRDVWITDAAAQTAMMQVMSAMTVTALDLRYDLLDIGFADDHPLCLELDVVAREWDVKFQAQRRAYPELVAHVGRPIVDTSPL